MPYLSAPWTYATISFLEKADLNLGVFSQVCKFHGHRLVLGISKTDIDSQTRIWSEPENSFPGVQNRREFPSGLVFFHRKSCLVPTELSFSTQPIPFVFYSQPPAVPPLQGAGGRRLNIFSISRLSLTGFISS